MAHARSSRETLTCSSAESNVPLFPSAHICLSKRGWVHYHTTHDHPHDDRWYCIPRDVLTYMCCDAWDRVRLLDDSEEIAPGLRTWRAGSHHRSTLAVEVEAPSGVVVITDAFFYKRNLDDNVPIGTGEIHAGGGPYDRPRRSGCFV